VRISGLVLAMTIVAAHGADAAPLVFYGADNGAGPGAARPNADAAAAAFAAATGNLTLINFEGLPVGPGSLALAPGVMMTLTGSLELSDPDFYAGVTATDRAFGEPIGYNTTAGGSQHLRMTPLFNSGGATVTYSFLFPILSFGSYFTDTELGFPGPLTVTFSDGSVQTLGIGKTNTGGGALFWGVTNLGAPISSISFNSGPTARTRDIWGMDDVLYESTAVHTPEPGSLLLLGAGLLGVARMVRRRGGRTN
jgi:hypothetical protein